MQTDIHVCWSAMEACLICLDVRAKQLLMVDADLIHASDHRFSAKVSKERVVELNVAWFAKTR